jgi:hypothetical protein
MSGGAAAVGDTRVRLLVREPRRVFCFWDVGPGSVASLRSERGERAGRLSRLAIRLSCEEQLCVDVLLPGPPSEGSGSHYLDVPVPGPVSAELGWLLPSGSFAGIASSNSVEVPGGRPTTRVAATRIRLPVAPGQLAELAARARPERERRRYAARRLRIGGASDAFG